MSTELKEWDLLVGEEVLGEQPVLVEKVGGASPSAVGTDRRAFASGAIWLGSPQAPWQEFLWDLWLQLRPEQAAQWQRTVRSVARVAGTPGAMVDEGLVLRQSTGEMRIVREAQAGADVVSTRLLLEECGTASLGFAHRALVSDGMLLVQDGHIAHVVAFVDDLCLPQSGWLDLVVTAVAMAVEQGQKVQFLREALRAAGLLGGGLREVHRIGRLGIQDGTGLRSWAELVRALRWCEGPAFLVLGGSHCVLPREVEEQLIDAKVGLVHLVDRPRAHGALLSRFIEVHGATSLRSALDRVFALAENERTVLVAPAIGESQPEQARWRQALAEEVGTL